MTVEETKRAFAELKAQGQTDEDILATLYVMFADDKISLKELENLINVLGYELTEEFKAMSPEEQKVNGYKEVDD